MFDLAALEGAGFEKQYSLEEWEELQASVNARYQRRAAGADVREERPGSHVTVNYVLQRGDVRVSTEQNTQDQAPYGIQTTVQYPEIAIIENVTDMRRVTCDARDTQLILALADQLAELPKPRR